MIPARRGWNRRLLAVSALAIVFLCSGCVYLRLLELKRQFGQFDRHFQLQTRDGVRLVCQKPVLLLDDIRWLGLRPETTRKLGRAEEWQIRLAKQLPPGVTERGSFHIAFQLTFAEQKLTALAIPESYFALMPKSFLIGVIKSLGGGDVDKSERKLESVVASEEIKLAQPRLPAIDKILGRPTEERADGAYTIQRFRYELVTKEAGAGVFEMTLRFHTATGDLVHWHGRTPVGDVAFKFGS